MSKVTDIQVALNSLISATLPAYDILPDSIDPTDNTWINLDKGFSTSYGAAENNSGDICNDSFRIQRNFPFILTNIYIPNYDPTYRLTIERSLMEDQYSVISAIESSITLGGLAINMRYSGDSGIEYLLGETKQFIALVSDITIEYIERF